MLDLASPILRFLAKDPDCILSLQVMILSHLNRKQGGIQWCAMQDAFLYLPYCTTQDHPTIRSANPVRRRSFCSELKLRDSAICLGISQAGCVDVAYNLIRSAAINLINS